MKNSVPAWLRVPVLFFVIFGLMEYFIDSGEKPAFIAYPITQFFLLMVLLLLIAIEMILKSVENVMFNTLSKKAQQRYLESRKSAKEWTWGKRMYQKLTASKPIAEEGEIILDHDYDGIKELDNRLPPWWIYLFYGTIIFAGIYLVRFHIMGDYTQKEEFEQEMAEARIAVEEYKKTAKDLIDASSVELLTDASDLQAGQTIFNTNCAVCHKPDGGGSIGPNLTDDYWILGGGISNVFHTISEGGRDGKGMVSWKSTLKPSEIAQVASYVISLHGTNPADAKAPEGDLYSNPDDSLGDSENPTTIEEFSATTSAETPAE
jgi:cytochrome c oxidase cbb3-type subunit 3